MCNMRTKYHYLIFIQIIQDAIYDLLEYSGQEVVDVHCAVHRLMEIKVKLNIHTFQEFRSQAFQVTKEVLCSSFVEYGNLHQNRFIC